MLHKYSDLLLIVFLRLMIPMQNLFVNPLPNKNYYIVFKNDSIDAKIKVDSKARFRVSGQSIVIIPSEELVIVRVANEITDHMDLG